MSERLIRVGLVGAKAEKAEIAFVFRLGEQNTRIDTASAQRCQLRLRMQCRQFQLDLGVAGAEAAEQRGDDWKLRRYAVEGDAQDLGLAFGKPAEMLSRRFHLGENSPAVIDHHAPCIGGPDAAADPLEQGDAKLGFQILDAPGKCRWGDAQSFGSALETSLLCGDQNVFQMMQIQTISQVQSCANM